MTEVRLPGRVLGGKMKVGVVGRAMPPVSQLPYVHRQRHATPIYHIWPHTTGHHQVQVPPHHIIQLIGAHWRVMAHFIGLAMAGLGYLATHGMLQVDDELVEQTLVMQH